ncbi:MAG: glycoside hydrolase family 88 protein [Ferruginibacter sp.]
MKNRMKYILPVLALACVMQATAQKSSVAEAVALTAMQQRPDSFSNEGRPAKWTYDMGVILEGVADVWKRTANPAYFNYVQKQIDHFIANDGTIKGYKLDDYNIDNVKNGTSILMLYRVTGKEKYWKAAGILREQLKGQPRTVEGGFWHKKVYPFQMWLDGLYMGEPFYAEYAMLAHDDTAFNDIANQFIWMEQHARDPKTGLLYHGWDESRQMAWADKQTGNSPNFWGRAIGWYVMALVDALDYFPVGHPKRGELIAILNRTVAGLEKVQDKKTGLWWDVLDKPEVPKNYLESSASSMFVYAIAKGVRLGYLPAAKISIAKKGYAGMLKKFIKKEGDKTNLEGTVQVSGLGGKPFRDGSVEYYLKEPVVTNDPKGVGSFIKAAVEMEMLPDLKLGAGKTVLLDNYFNHETTKDITGTTIQTHYVWDEKDNGGYSLLGDIFNSYGVQTKSLKEGPTAANLQGADIYFLIDPDWPKENKNPNYIEQQHIDAIYNWVQKGGVLMMFSNDSNNVEFKNYNRLAEKFGIHFNENNPRNLVKGNDYPTGTINIPKGNAIFKTAKNIYIKEISTLTLTAPAKAVLTDKGDNIIAVSKVGKGTVFAIGDPWLYNEYVDGRKLPAYLENFKAAQDLVRWLVKQTR